MSGDLMRAASLAVPGVVEVGDFPVPVPGEGQVLVEMHYASICGSDVHVVFDGFHDPDFLGEPGYPGHEGIGRVVASRSPQFTAGTQVLTVPHGRRGRCFAEYQAVDAAQVIALPDGADPRRMLLAQQLGTTVFGMKKFLPPELPDERRPRNAVVIGAGSAGLFYVQHLVKRGIEVCVSDLDERRLATAARLGAARTVHEPAASVVDVALEMTGGAGADLVIEAAGYDFTRAAAVEAARIRGTIGFFGFPELRGNAPFPVERSFRKSLSMEWVNGTQLEPGLLSFRAAIDAIARGAIEVDHCLEAMYPLDLAPDAFAAAWAHGHGAAKVCVRMPVAGTGRDAE
ncbi:zinc-binding dehydrogenase [Streptomyces pinistramenti]|uniref:zinc-binding dehydrogenase n=1 Tax=Streptomyces pinistramenti TaxID=2884812 RepID=UPI001D063841|nr:zinc-binding dehydrogenase [Streptomyces pinistramenti]MCB5906530.1 zinc-binding dehydrogenase [Streptomyces pinistramenti]